MSAYLQRLYDAGLATPPGSTNAEPAQRSASPLVAVDQRMTSSAFAGSFLLGLPDDASTDLVAEPVPLRHDEGWAESDEPLSPGLAGTLRAPAPEGPALIPPASDIPALSGTPRTPQPDPSDASTMPVGRVTPQERRLEPSRPVHLAQSDDVVRSRSESGPRVADPSPQSSTPSVHPAQSSLLAPPDPAVEAPSREPQEPAQPVPPDTGPTFEPKTPPGAILHPGPTVEPRTSPEATLHPTPLAVPQPLPPPPTTPRWSDLAERVHRMVHDEVAAAVPAQTPGREAKPAAAAAADLARPRPTTAEAASVIGPLDRPTRTTTLYGLRLR
jgi:hypothetical protein